MKHKRSIPGRARGAALVVAAVVSFLISVAGGSFYMMSAQRRKSTEDAARHKIGREANLSTIEKLNSLLKARAIRGFLVPVDPMNPASEKTVYFTANPANLSKAASTIEEYSFQKGHAGTAKMSSSTCNPETVLSTQFDSVFNSSTSGVPCNAIQMDITLNKGDTLEFLRVSSAAKNPGMTKTRDLAQMDARLNIGPLPPAPLPACTISVTPNAPQGGLDGGAYLGNFYRSRPVTVTAQEAPLPPEFQLMQDLRPNHVVLLKMHGSGTPLQSIDAGINNSTTTRVWQQQFATDDAGGTPIFYRAQITSIAGTSTCDTPPFTVKEPQPPGCWIQPLGVVTVDPNGYRNVDFWISAGGTTPPPQEYVQEMFFYESRFSVGIGVYAPNAPAFVSFTPWNRYHNFRLVVSSWFPEIYPSPAICDMWLEIRCPYRVAFCGDNSCETPNDNPPACTWEWCGEDTMEAWGKWCVDRGPTPGCFDPHTRILLASGKWKEAQDIRAGELLWNPIRRQAVPVARRIRGPEAKPMVEITVGGRTLLVTSGHPMMSDRGLVKAEALGPKDRLLDEGGGWMPIQRLRRPPRRKDQSVINFSLAVDSDSADAHALVAEGIVTGDFAVQGALADGLEEE